MKYTPSYCAAILAVAILNSIVTAQTPVDPRDSDPIVTAVEKSIASVVAIRVPRQGEKDMIGAGVIVAQDNVIITNRHVTGGKKYVNVKLSDGAEVKGEVVAADADLDLAIVRVNHKKVLPALTLGTKEDLRLAEKVIAIGSPYGYEGTVSVGILSAKNREIPMPNDVIMTGLIQHTAAINPGNSGGPLLNINGKVIGINVAMRDGAQNIAFAINASVVTNFLNRNLNAQRVAGVDHGIKCEDKFVAKVADPQRVVVKNASHDAVKSGDEIVAVGAMRVANTFDVERALWSKKPGQQVEVKLVRQGREMAVTVTLGASQGAGSVAAVSQETPAYANAATNNVRSTSER